MRPARPSRPHLFAGALATAALSLLATRAAHAQAPPNDTRANPVEILEPLPFIWNQSTAFATPNPAEDQREDAGASVWFSFRTANRGMDLRLHTLGSDYDTLLQVFEEGQFRVVGDNENGLQTDITFGAGRFKDFLFMVGSHGPGGNLVFTVEDVTPPWSAPAGPYVEFDPIVSTREIGQGDACVTVRVRDGNQNGAPIPGFHLTAVARSVDDGHEFEPPIAQAELTTNELGEALFCYARSAEQHGSGVDEIDVLAPCDQDPGSLCPLPKRDNAVAMVTWTGEMGPPPLRGIEPATATRRVGEPHEVAPSNVGPGDQVTFRVSGVNAPTLTCQNLPIPFTYVVPDEDPCFGVDVGSFCYVGELEGEDFITAEILRANGDTDQAAAKVRWVIELPPSPVKLCAAGFEAALADNGLERVRFRATDVVTAPGESLGTLCLVANGSIESVEAFADGVPVEAVQILGPADPKPFPLPECGTGCPAQGGAVVLSVPGAATLEVSMDVSIPVAEEDTVDVCVVARDEIDPVSVAFSAPRGRTFAEPCGEPAPAAPLAAVSPAQAAEAPTSDCEGAPLEPALSPETATSVVGETHCLQPGFDPDGSFALVSGDFVVISVSGANAPEGFPLTTAVTEDECGNQSFSPEACYTGTTEGVDTITACVFSEQGFLKARATATVTWIAAPPPPPPPPVELCFARMDLLAGENGTDRACLTARIAGSLAAESVLELRANGAVVAATASGPNGPLATSIVTPGGPASAACCAGCPTEGGAIVTLPADIGEFATVTFCIDFVVPECVPEVKVCLVREDKVTGLRCVEGKAPRAAAACADKTPPVLGLAPRAADLVGAWPFEGDGSGKRPVEIVGGSFAAGLVGQALALTGSGYAARPGDDAAFDFEADDFTIHLLVNFNSTAGEQVLIQKRDPDSGAGWVLTKLAEGPLLFASFRADGSEALAFQSDPGLVTDGVWHQVVVRRSGGTIEILLDGTSVKSLETSEPVGDSSARLFIGNSATGDAGFDGLIDEVGIWRAALGDGDLADLLASGVFQPGCPPATLALQCGDTIPEPPMLVALDDTDDDVAVSFSEVATAGTITRTWTATDACTNTASCTQLISIGGRPVAIAGDVTVGCTGPTTQVMLDGSASNDPQGLALSYVWFRDGEPIATGAQPTIGFELGQHTIELVVSNGHCESDPDTVLVTVQDTAPPETTATVSPQPDENGIHHTAVSAALSAVDACSNVDRIVYSLDGGEPEEIAGATDTITIENDGEHVLVYYAVDAFENAESPQTLTVTIVTCTDATAPVIGTAPRAENIVGGWPMNGDGAGWRPVEIVGGAFAAGLVGQALALTGSGYAARPGDDAAFDFGTGDFTIQLLVKLTSPVTSEQVLIEKRDPTTGAGWLLTMFSSRRLLFASFRANNQGETVALQSGSGAVTAGVWQQIVVRRSGIAFAILVNGVEVAYIEDGANPSVVDSAVPLFIGMSATGEAGVRGLIDEVGIWQEALGDEELASLRVTGVFQPGCPTASIPINCGDAIPEEPALMAIDDTDDQVTVIPSVVETAGTITRTWTATDDCGNPAVCTQQIVIGGRPVAMAEDVTVDCVGPTTPVALDGSASTDPQDAPLSYAWFLDGAQIASEAQPTVDLAPGEHTIALVVSNGQCESDPKAILVTVVDTVPPETTATADPPPNGNGWNNTAVSVALAATDACSNVNRIVYALDGGDPVEVPGAMDTITIESDGVHELVYYAVDEFENIEPPHTLTVRIDTVPPTCSGPPSADPACEAAIPSVLFSFEDELSGIVPESAVQTPAAGTIVGSGEHTIDFSVADAADNVGTCQTTFTVGDAIPPVIGMGPGGLVGYWPFDGDGLGKRPVEIVGEPDFEAGLFGQAIALTGSEYAARPGDDAPFDFGTDDFTIQLLVQFTSPITSEQGEQVLIEKRDPTTGAGWLLTRFSDDFLLFASFLAGGGETVALGGIATFSPGEWHQIVVRRSGIAFAILVDGGEVAYIEDGNHPPVVDSAAPLFIGMSAAGGFGVHGLIDEVAIWRAALGDEDLAALRVTGVFQPGCPAASLDVGCGDAIPEPPALIAMDDSDDDVPVIFSEVEELGTITRTWTATDDCENAAICTQVISASRDETPPTIECPQPQPIVVQADRCQEGAPGAAVDFTVTATDDCDDAPAVVCDPPSGSVFPLGTTIVRCTAMDASGNSSECSFPVTVEGIEVVSAAPSTTCLWPPDHRLVPVGLTFTVARSGGHPLSIAVRATCNEARDLVGVGDGTTSPDIGGDTGTDLAEQPYTAVVTLPVESVVEDPSGGVTAATTIHLRAERQGNREADDGRFYSIVLEVTDTVTCRTVVSGPMHISVLHDQRPDLRCLCGSADCPSPGE
ncbi:MAG: LamG domain-containing protein [Actinobacteria bacterium]|nr:LamG domain-containing protein [Actinomycetota bacterium]